MTVHHTRSAIQPGQGTAVTAQWLKLSVPVLDMQSVLLLFVVVVAMSSPDIFLAFVSFSLANGGYLTAS